MAAEFVVPLPLNSTTSVTNSPNLQNLEQRLDAFAQAHVPSYASSLATNDEANTTVPIFTAVNYAESQTTSVPSTLMLCESTTNLTPTVAVSTTAFEHDAEVSMLPGTNQLLDSEDGGSRPAKTRDGGYIPDLHASLVQDSAAITRQDSVSSRDVLPRKGKGTAKDEALQQLENKLKGYEWFVCPDIGSRKHFSQKKTSVPTASYVNEDIVAHAVAVVPEPTAGVSQPAGALPQNYIDYHQSSLVATQNSCGVLSADSLLKYQPVNAKEMRREKRKRVKSWCLSVERVLLDDGFVTKDASHQPLSRTPPAQSATATATADTNSMHAEWGTAKEHQKPFFHGKLSRNEAQQTLYTCKATKTIGWYLVRQRDDATYVFSALLGRRFKHSLLAKDPVTRLYTMDGRVLPSTKCNALGRAVGAVATIMGCKYGMVMKALPRNQSDATANTRSAPAANTRSALAARAEHTHKQHSLSDDRVKVAEWTEWMDKKQKQVAQQTSRAKRRTSGPTRRTDQEDNTGYLMMDPTVKEPSTVKIDGGGAVWSVPLFAGRAQAQAGYINEDIVARALAVVPGQSNAAPIAKSQRKRSAASEISELSTMNRQTAEYRLSKLGVDGGYLIRKKDTNKVAVSCLIAGKLDHFLISYTRGKWVYKGSELDECSLKDAAESVLNDNHIRHPVMVDLNNHADSTL